MNDEAWLLPRARTMCSNKLYTRPLSRNWPTTVRGRPAKGCPTTPWRMMHIARSPFSARVPPPPPLADFSRCEAVITSMKNSLLRVSGISCGPLQLLSFVCTRFSESRICNLGPRRPSVGGENTKNLFCTLMPLRYTRTRTLTFPQLVSWGRNHDCVI